MFTTIIILCVIIMAIKFLKLYQKQPTTYNQLLRKGLVLELLLMKKQAVISYENGLAYLSLNEEEKSNIHYLIGIIMQEQHNTKYAIEHFNEAFKMPSKQLVYNKDLQKVLDAYENDSEEKKEWISSIFKQQTKYDRRFKKLKYP